MTKIQIIFIAFFLILGVKSFEIECEFKYVYYTCVTENFTRTSKDDFTITSVIGKHHDDWDNSYVHRFALKGLKWNFFPKNILDVFPNVNVLHIEDTNINSITSNDLKPFERLTSVTISGNKIEKITSDLFKHTPNLKDLDLDGNQIKIIESGAFDGLKKLNFFYIRDNPCTKEIPSWSQAFARNRNDVTRLIPKLEEACKG